MYEKWTAEELASEIDEQRAVLARPVPEWLKYDGGERASRERVAERIENMRCALVAKRLAELRALVAGS